MALVLAEAGLGWFFLAQIPAVVLTLVITGWLVPGSCRCGPRSTRTDGGPSCEPLAYAIAVALNATYFRVAVVALSLLATERETSVFATAFRVIEVLIAVPALIVGAAFPLLVRAARDDHDRLDYAAGRLVDVSVVLGTWLALGLFLGAEPIIELLAGDGWEASVALLRIESAALIAPSSSSARATSCCLSRRHRDILLANIAGLTASVVLTAILVPVDEATGAAVALLGAETVLAVASLAAVIRHRPAVGRSLARAQYCSAPG